MKKILLIVILTYSLLSSKEVTLQLPWKYQFQFAGYIIAKEKGFYNDIDLDVNLREFHSDINVIKELDEDNIEYFVSRPTSMIDISKGNELIYLATIFQSSPLILLTDKSLNINSLSDLKNKRIMTSGDLSSDVSLISMMFSRGITLDNLIIQDPSFNTKDLIDNNTDLIASYISNEPFILKELGGNPVIFNPKDYGFDFYSDILTTSKKYMHYNEKEVKNFRDASLKGWEYAFSNIDESVEIIYNKYNTQNKSKESLKYEANELKKLAYYNTNELGKIEAEKLEKIYNIYKLLGLAQKNINFNEIIYNDLNIKLNLTNEEISYLANKQPINMCINSDWTPFEQLDKNNKYIGLAADFYSIIEKELSTKFSLITTNSLNESLDNINSNKCDFISLTTKNNIVEKELNLSSTIFKVPLVITTKLDVPFVNKLEYLKDKKIAVPKKYINSEEFKKKYPNLNIIEVEDSKDGLKLLNEGKVYGFIGTLYTVSYHIQKEYFNDLKIAGKIDDELEFVLGVNKEDKILYNILQKAMNKMDPILKNSIIDKWGSTIYDKTIDYDLVFQIITPFILIIIFGVFFYTKLKFLNAKLSDQKKFINTILDIQPNLILIVNNFEPIFANKFFLDFFECKSIEEFKNKYSCLAQTFIQEDLFFHLGKIKDNNTWIENILKLNHEKRIVSIFHQSSTTTKVFNVSIVELEDNKYLISLTDISNTILKQIQLENKSTHDKLTGAYNREYFESHKQLIINEYTKDNNLLIFSILDIDFFKKVNDTYGHDVGDKVLKQFVEIIKKSSRNDDILIRWGGEEFILLLKVSSKSDIDKVLENIRKSIDNSFFEIVNHITCSIGATIYKHNEEIEHSFKRADDALYEAKNNGRNIVVIK